MRATFAAGCFWGVESTFRKVKGVTDTQVGYVGGLTDKPTYKQVCGGDTGHAEAVEVTFNPTVVSYDDLLQVFWDCHDPTQLNRQGPDVGSQYRSAIFYHNAEQKNQAAASFKKQEKKMGKIVTTITKATQFFRAEEYHQQYIEKGMFRKLCRL
jgi:peptide-methionine (S)-S-oxide reductase